MDDIHKGRKRGRGEIETTAETLETTTDDERRSSGGSVVGAEPVLNTNISLYGDLTLERLPGETIVLANKIVAELNSGDNSGDPGVIAQILNAAAVHTALALQHSPVPQGATAEDSVAALRGWMIAGALTVPGVTPLKQYPAQSNSLAFHHLSLPEAVNITIQQWQDILWVAEIMSQQPRLEMPLVLLISGTGPGTCDMCVVPHIFG
jgi:hypothetical protein